MIAFCVHACVTLDRYVYTLAWCYTPVGNQYAGVTNEDDNGAGEFELQGERRVFA
jgi:hypothetical protein